MSNRRRSSHNAGGTGAAHFSSSFGTELDRWNCPFYHKIGACRHGDRCARNHVRPSFSQTLSIPHMYIPPQGDDSVAEQAAFEDFFEDVLQELKKYGNIIDMIVVENYGEHLNGNVYVRYDKEREASACVAGLKDRYYNGILLQPTLSPVTDFREARCRQHEDETCNRGGYCNFMHIRRLPRWLQKELDKARKETAHSSDKGRDRDRVRDKYDSDRGRYGRDRYDPDRREGRGRSRSRSPPRSPHRHRDDSRERSRSRSREGRGRERTRDDSRSNSPIRSNSAERRAQIARWNQQRG